MNEIESLVRTFAGGSGNPDELGSAAQEHVAAMAPQDVAGQLQTASSSLQQSGRPDLAAELEGIVAQHGVSSESLKDAAVAVIKDHPEVLTHFAPAFAQGIAAKL